MIYPPGIPIIIPGERFSKEVIDQLEYYEKINTKVLSDHKDGKVSVIDFENWDNNEDKK